MFVYLFVEYMQNLSGMFVISKFRKLGQMEFEASLGCIVGHSLKIKLAGKQRMKERRKARKEKNEGGRGRKRKGRGREHPFAC